MIGITVCQLVPKILLILHAFFPFQFSLYWYVPRLELIAGDGHAGRNRLCVRARARA
jgi:hypothetical protein